MKRKLIKNNIAKVETLLNEAKHYGVPFWLYYRDMTMHIIDMEFYKNIKRRAFTKQGRLDGAYEAWIGQKPPRLCVGRKGKL